MDMEKLKELEMRLEKFVPQKAHDEYALEAVKEAMKAAKNGTYGVGAVLVHDEVGIVMFRGHNKVFSEQRSDLHAEMDVLNTFERIYKEKGRENIKDFTMFSSLESCPMCLCRIITSGLDTVYHIADDKVGGMVHLYDNLPPVWKELSEGRTFEKANCSDELSAISEQIFQLTVDLDNKLRTPDPKTKISKQEFVP